MTDSRPALPTPVSALRHVVTVDQFDASLLERLFARADDHSRSIVNARRHHRIGNILTGHILYRLFYEASTRTYESFGFAGVHLGMGVLGTQSVQFSSVSKGETLEDTIRMICSYAPSIIVLRHNEDDAALRAAEISTVPIISGGTGRAEHPTQTLLDYYTIRRHFDDLDGKTLVLGGDLANGRTTNGLALLMARLHPGCTIIGISDPMFRMQASVQARLRAYGATYEETDDLRNGLAEANIVYWTRTQKERLTQGQEDVAEYVIDTPQLELMRSDAILMHPLPRIGEITRAVDLDPRSVYLFEQPSRGMHVRMSIMEWALGEFD